VPGTDPVKCTGAVAVPLHTTWLATGFTVGVGKTVTVAVMFGPAQPLAVGVMVKVTTCVTAVVLVSVPLIGEPDPLAAIPVTFTLLSLVQVKVVPATSLVSTIGVIGLPEQTVCADGVATACGVGFTVTVAVTGGPVQVTPPLV